MGARTAACRDTPVIVDLCTGSAVRWRSRCRGHWPGRPHHRRRRLRRRRSSTRDATSTDTPCRARECRRHRTRTAAPNSTVRSICSSRTRRTSRTARNWNPKWPNMIRRTRCSADPTGCTSSTPIVDARGQAGCASGCARRRRARRHDRRTRTVEALHAAQGDSTTSPLDAISQVDPGS